MLIMIFMKKVAVILLFLAICASGSEDESVDYYESWRYGPYPYAVAPYYSSYYYGNFLTAPYFYDSTGDFDPSRPYIGLSYGYSYGNYSRYRYPFYNSWWNGYSVYMNLFPKRYLNPADKTESPPVAGSAPLILKAKEPKSPMDFMLDNFLNTTNRTELKSETTESEE